jgi:hypothetical protein
VFVRVGVGDCGDAVVSELVRLLSAARAAVAGGGARCSAPWPLLPPPSWVRAGMTPASSMYGTTWSRILFREFIASRS